MSTPKDYRGRPMYWKLSQKAGGGWACLCGKHRNTLRSIQRHVAWSH